MCRMEGKGGRLTWREDVKRVRFELQANLFAVGGLGECVFWWGRLHFRGEKRLCGREETEARKLEVRTRELLSYDHRSQHLRHVCLKASSAGGSWFLKLLMQRHRARISLFNSGRVRVSVTPVKPFWAVSRDASPAECHYPGFFQLRVSRQTWRNIIGTEFILSVSVLIAQQGKSLDCMMELNVRAMSERAAVHNLQITGCELSSASKRDA